MKRALRITVITALILMSAATVRAQGTLPYTSLSAFITDLKASIPRAGTEAFVEPSPADRDAFRVAMQQLLTGDVPSALTSLDALNYDLKFLNDLDFVKSYLVAQERSAGFKGLGTYIVDPNFDRNLVMEVPHPIFDINTPEEGTAIFQNIGARALLIAGTHRCANLGTPSGCSGTTTACGSSQPYRISDAPHFTGNFMHAAHEASLSLTDPPVTFNLHGNNSEVPDIELSDGTKNVAPDTATVNRLRNALEARLASVASCNWTPDDPPSLNKCGTANVQGRRSNDSSEPCTLDPPAASGRFLHIEQHRNIRDDPSVLIDALLEVFPLP